LGLKGFVVVVVVVAVMLLSGINLIIYSLLQFPRLPDKALANGAQIQVQTNEIIGSC